MGLRLTLLGMNGRLCMSLLYCYPPVLINAGSNRYAMPDLLVHGSPYPYPGHTHIPMSLEKQCNATAFVPHDKRKDTAVIMGKLTQYYFPNRSGDLPPPLEAWTEFRGDTGLEAIGNARPLVEGAEDEPQGTPEGVVNRGPMGREEYTKQVGEARMMVGIGMPAISPSPYLAL
jgi:hypothetical protein